MNYKKCVYFVEGPCEAQFIEALNKVEPFRMAPGKPDVFNVIQGEIPRRVINAIKPGSTVAFVFDTDVDKTDTLLKNIQHVKDYVPGAKIVLLMHVKSFEDELVRATDLKKAQDFTQSASVREFKAAFCAMKQAACRSSLNRHKLDMKVIWVTKPPKSFDFTEKYRNIERVILE